MPDIKNMDGRIACVEVTRPETHAGMYCIYRLASFSAADELDGEEEGGRIVLTLRLMTEEEINELPDFEGW